VESQAVDIVQTYGYADPEYSSTGRLKPATDLYSLGVVMLEVLTGNQPAVAVWEGTKTLVSWALPPIEAGQLGDVLDRRPATEPTPRQREALQLVGITASSCLRLQGDSRPAIPDVVANLEKAFATMCLVD
jgi:serine/threonine protein kinase